MSSSGGTKAVLAALAANLGIAVTKFVAYLLTQSASMLAEAIHSVADSGNQALLLIGGKRAQRVASPSHQFGYGRARYVYAFIVSIVLFSLGGCFALFEAWEKFHEPHPIEGRWWWVPIAVLGAAIVMEGISFRTAVREANHVRGDKGYLQYIRESRAPEIPVVLLEDLGALLGLVLALFGVSMTLGTGDGRWDAVGSGAIGLLLVVIAVFLAIEMSSMLLGESADPQHQRAIEAAIVGDGIVSVIHLRTLHLGPDELLVAAKVEVERADDAAHVADAIDGAEQRIRAAVPLKIQIYIEPDLRRPAPDVTPTP